jgi:UDP-N-acetylglucosamine 2-epimerase (non-hydrolysing)
MASTSGQQVTSGGQRVRVLVVLGTRPEAIKLAPVVEDLRNRPGAEVRVCATGQHRDLLDQFLPLLNTPVDHDLDVMREDQTPSAAIAAIVDGVTRVLDQERPDWLVIQGDTTTIAATALAGFYARVPVAHVEAGLRTHRLDMPVPEEFNRRLATLAASLHFAPTARAAACLFREGVPAERVWVTGNPGIDSLRLTRDRLGDPTIPTSDEVRNLLSTLGERSLILATAHRRESIGPPLASICTGLKEVAAKHADAAVLALPVHPNPRVRHTILEILAGANGVWLLPPLDYFDLVRLLERSRLVITDSGGLQEEAPAVGVPVLTIREVTERPDAVDAGVAKVIGTDGETIFREADKLMTDSSAYAAMARGVSPYGDGQASRRIGDALLGLPVDEFDFSSSGTQTPVGVTP